MDNLQKEKQNERKTVEVRLSVDAVELEEIKGVTKVDSAATAVMAAARMGVDYLKSVKPVAKTAEGVEVQQ